MEPLTILLLGSLVTFFLGIVSFLLTHRIKTQDDKIKTQDEKIETMAVEMSTLKSTAVSDSHVRAVVKEELQPLNATLTKVADSMEAIKEYIAEEKGFKAGAAAARRRVEDET